MNLHGETHAEEKIRDAGELDNAGLKRARLALKKNEARLREAERIANIGHWEMDVATGKSHWSDGFYRICGLEPGSIEPTAEMGMKIIHPDDRERARAEVKTAVNQGKPYEIQKRIVRPDGAVRIVESRGEIILDKQGKPLKMVGTFLDITERKKAEDEVRRLNEELEKRVALRTHELRETMEKLRESEERFRSVVDSMDDVIFTLDREQRHTGVYGQWVEKSGFTPEMFLGKTSAQILGPENAAPHEKANREALKGKLTIYDWTANYPDGSIRHFQTALSPLRDAGGQIVGITGVGRDITGHKRNEEAVTASLELFRLMGSASIEEIIQTGLEEGERLTHSQIAYFHLVNPDQKTIALQAWSRNTFNYCSAEEKATHYPIDQAGVWVDCIHQRKPVVHNDYQSLTHKKGLPEGHVPVTRDIGVPVFEGDKIVAVIGVGNKKSDYTDFDVNQLSLIAENIWSIIQRMRAQEELRAAKDEAERANRSKSEFLANMSHEIRTPLNAVTGFSEILSSLVKDERQQNYLNSIKTAGKSLLTLINDILDLSKMEAGMMKIQFSPVNLRIILDEIEQIFKLKVSKKNLSFNVNIAPGLPALLILDEARLRQVLLNLAGNAVKFTEQGTVTINARCEFHQDNPTTLNLIIAISDTGIGIPKEEQENIFESFRQQSGQSNRKYGGTGLGLSISKKLSHMMNGTIDVSSTPGAGSVFTLTLQDVKVAEHQPAEEERNLVNFGKIRFEKASVLVVDDVESNRLLMEELLGEVGLEVYSAENGEEALIMAKELKPELILMDIRMPVMDGIECTMRLREDLATKDIPVVALSASTQIAERHVIAQAGFDDYLSKPVTMHFLYQSISKFLDCAEGPEEAENKNGEKAAAGPDKFANAIDLPLLAATLKREILPLLPAITGAKRIKDVKLFARRLLTLGRYHRAAPVSEIAEQLSTFAARFDITSINRTVERIPGIIDQLEKEAKASEH